jgi:hypothetical protein
MKKRLPLHDFVNRTGRGSRAGAAQTAPASLILARRRSFYTIDLS